MVIGIIKRVISALRNKLREVCKVACETRIKETSKIEVRIDGTKLDYSPQSSVDAVEKAVNKILEGAKKAEVVERITIERR